MKKEQFFLTIISLIFFVSIIVIVGSLMGVTGYLINKAPEPSVSPQEEKNVSRIERSQDKKAIIDSDTQEVILTIDDTQKYLKESGYVYTPKSGEDNEIDDNSSESLGISYGGDCFGAMALSNTKGRIIFSTSCSSGDASKPWIGIYTFDHSSVTGKAQIKFLTGSSGRGFVWSSEDKSVSYDADIPQTGKMESRTIDPNTGSILGKRNSDVEDQDPDWSYNDARSGLEISYPENWNFQQKDYDYKISKNNCHFDISRISPEEYVRAVEYTDGKKSTGCVLAYWWQIESFSGLLPKKISCNTKLNSQYYDGYYFQNGARFFRILPWDEKDNYLDSGKPLDPNSLDCGEYFKMISSSLSFSKVTPAPVFSPDSIDSTKLINEGEIYKILKDFATKPALIGSYNDGNLLLDTVMSRGAYVNFKDKLSNEEAKLGKMGPEIKDDAGIQSLINANTKVCVARSIIYNDLKHTCGVSEDSFVSLDEMNVTTLSEAVLPYFLAGVAYYQDGEYDKARYYLGQIDWHRRAGIMRFGESYFGGVYDEIYKEAKKLLNENKG